MTATGPHTDWPAPVIAYLAAALPRETGDGRDGWNDHAMTAWQFGCMALVALGQAQPEPWGAQRINTPKIPSPLPRWDDICWVVLSVMDQKRDIEYRTADGSRFETPRRAGQFVVRPIYPEGQEPRVPKPNIAAAFGCGPARVRPDLMAVLEALGLVADGRWTARAEKVMWRAQTRAWQMNIVEDHRFDAALQRCLETMPGDVVEHLRDLADITPHEIASDVARQEAANAELILQYPAHAKFDRTVTPERQFRSLVFIATGDMDDLFFAGWRLSDGWLADDEAARALPLFHDPLARMMRGAALEALGIALPKEMPQ
ncbi:MAG: hypothetical protein AAF601_09525 [Pseudomonadota bacterium]